MPGWPWPRAINPGFRRCPLGFGYHPCLFSVILCSGGRIELERGERGELPRSYFFVAAFFYCGRSGKKSPITAVVDFRSMAVEVVTLSSCHNNGYFVEYNRMVTKRRY